MELSAGTRLGPYEIVSLLGAGGMGEVYKARDTRLDRTVAIKVLNSSLAASPDLKPRFEREARAISSLQHPNICVLHDIGSQEGTDFLVMEYLEGESLADRLRRGALSLEQVVKVGCEIADALDKAHRIGIVHRDLKPGNIMLTGSGAKLLDFGLAKPAALGAAAGTPSAPLLSATMTAAAPQQSPLTVQGSMVGTVQYMAPEQLEGREADARSDIFALGAVLYEMATGKRAFEGKTQISVASAILEKDPDPVSAVAHAAPAELDRLIATCLAKNPEDRLQAARDVRLQLQWVSQAPPRNVKAQAGKAPWLGWAAALLMGMVALLGWMWNRAPSAGAIAASILPPAGVVPTFAGRNGQPQISPDGSKIAFVGCRAGGANSGGEAMTGGVDCSLWVRTLSSTSAREVEGTNGGYFPFWSPDSRTLGFFADGKLKRVAADGGPVQVICDAEDARGGSWSKSGMILFAPTRGSVIFRVPAEGGTPVAVTRKIETSAELAVFGSHRWPYFLPDGQHFLYVNAPTASCGSSTELHFASVDGQTDRAILHSCSTAAYSGGSLMYWRDGNLTVQPFEVRGGVLSGAPQVIAGHAAFDSLFARADFSISEDGKLAYVAGDEKTGSQLIWHDHSGKTLNVLGGDADYDSIAISPDGNRVAYNSAHGVWVLDSRGAKTRLFSGESAITPAWSSEGKRLYFSSSRDGKYEIVSVATDGSGDVQTVLAVNDIPGRLGALRVSTSVGSRYLTFVISSPTSKLDIYALALDGKSKPQPVLQSPANEDFPEISPDGKWLAYQSDESGRSGVYLTPFPGGGAQYQVSTAGGEKPVWARSGKELFYRAPDLRLMSVAVAAKGNAIQLGTPQPLFEMPLRNLNGKAYDVTPDGRFLTNSSPRMAAQNIELLVNWPAAEKK